MTTKKLHINFFLQKQVNYKCYIKPNLRMCKIKCKKTHIDYIKKTYFKKKNTGKNYSIIFYIIKIEKDDFEV